jgi:acyl-coenzyme A synthetase/AMP-(fatty) acid ligase
VACVLPKTGADVDPAEVLAWAWERIAKFKLSRVEVVDELPVNPSGKVMKFKLREALT